MNGLEQCLGKDTAGQTTNVRVYPATKSSLDDKYGEHPEHRSFINVWNRNTPEYDGTELERNVESVDWIYCRDHTIEQYRKLAADSTDAKRGNIQVSLGYSGGRNQGDRTSANFGATMPRLRVGTTVPKHVDLLVASSKIVTSAGVHWAVPKNISSDPELAKRHSLAGNQIHPEVVVEVVTIIGCKLADGVELVKGHFDTENAKHPHGQVVLVQKVMEDDDGE